MDFLGLRSRKDIYPHIFHRNICNKGNKLNKNVNNLDHSVLRGAASHLKIFHMFENSICFNYLEFLRNI